MTPIFQYLKDRIVPADSMEAKKLKATATRYMILQDQLYQREFSWPLLKCVLEHEGKYILQEVYEGICGSHIGARSLARKIMCFGYFWPRMEEDASNFVRACEKCQLHANLHDLPAHELHSMFSPIPFYQRGMNILGHFPKTVGGKQFLFVAVDYFTK